MITDINQLDLTKKYTYADYLAWQFQERVELLRGYISKMAAPNRVHQKVSINLSVIFSNHLKGNPCEVYAAPFDVRLSKRKDDRLIKTVVQPDICIVCDTSKLDDRGCLGAPELIVEILSKSTSKKDLKDKKDLYEENGVEEYWVVHPREATIARFLLKNGKYEFDRYYTEGDVLLSMAIDDLALDVTEAFID